MKRHDTTTESATAFAARLGVSPRTVQRLISLGRVPTVRLGRRVLVVVAPALEALGLGSVSCEPWTLLRLLNDARAGLACEIARRDVIDAPQLDQLSKARDAIDAVLLALDCEVRS